MQEISETSALQTTKPRWWRLLWVVVPLAVAIWAGIWFVTHPSPLDASPDAITVTTPVGIPIYVQVYSTGVLDGRDLRLSDVSVSEEGTGAVDVVPLVCHQGSFSVTTAPLAFCQDLVPAAGSLLGPGDQLALQITGESAGTVTLGRSALSYRDGIQWGTSQPAGRPVVVTVLAR